MAFQCCLNFGVIENFEGFKSEISNSTETESKPKSKAGKCPFM